MPNRTPPQLSFLVLPTLLLVASSGCSFHASVSASTKKSKTAANAEEIPSEAPEASEPAASSQPAKEPSSKAKVTVKGSQLVVSSSPRYAGDSADVPPKSEAALSELLKYLQQNQRVTRLRIEGHTHNTRAEPASLQLSGQRASSLKAWLVQKGVPADRIVAVGFGQQAPLESNATPAGQAANERIAFHIASVDGKPYLGVEPLAGGTEFP